MNSAEVIAAYNQLIEHWNTKQRQRIPLSPEWHAWMVGLSDCIDRIGEALAAMKARETEDAR